jgi:hypothetical protein
MNRSLVDSKTRDLIGGFLVLILIIFGVGFAIVSITTTPTHYDSEFERLRAMEKEVARQKEIELARIAREKEAHDSERQVTGTTSDNSSNSEADYDFSILSGKPHDMSDRLWDDLNYQVEIELPNLSKSERKRVSRDIWRFHKNSQED